MLCSVMEHGIMLLCFKTAIHKNEAKLSPFVQFDDEMTSWSAL